MTKRRVRAAAVLAVAAVLVFGVNTGGCRSPLGAASETGSLRLQLGPPSGAKLIGPEISMEAALYEVSGSGPGGRSFFEQTSGIELEVTGLVFGSWTVEVEAYNDINLETRVWIGHGSKGAVVHAGRATEVRVEVSPLPGPGNLFELQVSWPVEEVETPQATGVLVHRLSGAEIPLSFSPDPPTGGQASCTVDTPPSGYYTLFFQLTDQGQLVVGKTEVVRIVQGQNTRGRWEFKKVNRPTGTIELEIDPQLQDPLEVSLSVQTECTMKLQESMTVNAAVAGFSASEVAFVWYVDGAAVALGISASYTHTATQAGYHRLDCTAFSLDGTRAGDAGCLITVTPVVWGIQQFGTSSSDAGYGIALDSYGNVHVAASTGGTFPGQTSSGGSTEWVVMKWDHGGSQQWVRQIGSTSFASARGIAVDLSGNVYAAGYTSASFPGQTSSGGTDWVVVKWASSGNQQWIRQFGSASGDNAYGVAVDAAGNVYAAGYTYGTFPGQASSGGTDWMVAKLDSSGSLSWVRQIGSSLDDQAQGIAVDGAGNVYAAGTSGGAFPGQTSSGGTDWVIVKWDSSGNLQWVKQLGSPLDDHAQGIAVDAVGNVHAAGYTIGGTIPGQTGSGSTDWVVVKWDSGGNTQWVRQISAGMGGTAYGVAVDGAGNVYATGGLYGAFPGQNNSGEWDCGVVKWDSSGNLQWARQIGSASDEEGMAIAAGVSGYVYVTGWTMGVMGPVGFGSEDVFVAAFTDQGERY